MRHPSRVKTQLEMTAWQAKALAAARKGAGQGWGRSCVLVLLGVTVASGSPTTDLDDIITYVLRMV